MPCFCADFDLDSFAAHEVQFPLCLVFYEVNVNYWSTVECWDCQDFLSLEAVLKRNT